MGLNGSISMHRSIIPNRTRLETYLCQLTKGRRNPDSWKSPLDGWEPVGVAGPALTTR